MNILMIICNPKDESKKAEYVKTYINEAKKCGHEIRIINIYDLTLGYLRFDKEKQDFDYPITDEIKQVKEQFNWANQLVFVYPIWYLSVPPIMLDFLTQFFAGAACEMTEKGPKPKMKDKTAVIMQSYSMPYFFMKYFCNDVPMKWWEVVLTNWCGPKIIRRFDFDMIDEVPEKRKQKWIKDIKKFVSKL